MKTQDTEFLARLRAAFEAEAAEHLQTISTGLLDLEKHAATAEAEPLIETIFRAAHSLKGAARAVNLTGVEAVCQALESVFAALKRQSLTFDENLFELLYETVDVLGQLLAADATGSPTETGTQRVMLIRRLEQAAQGTPLPPAPKPPGKLLGVLSSGAEAAQARPALEDKASHGQGANAVEPALASEALAERTETIRIAKARLNALLLQAEELLSVKLGTGQLAAELRELRAQSAEWERQWAQTMPEARRTRRQVRKRSGLVLSLDDAARLLGFLDWNQEYVRTLQQRVAALAQTATREHRATAGMVDNLMAGVRQAVLMPFDALLESFPKLARDLARSQDKAVELVIEGGQIEIDRRLLEALKDPLIHLVRNSIDHGLEAPPERLAKGKPERGTITIAAEQRGSNRLTVTLSDDGAGIQLARVRQAAVKAGLLAREEAELDAQAVFDLISHSGLTTSPVVTELSGRGLGLAILRERVEQLGGTVELETQP
jgi:two-component system, chemotaxis family, sensor kinase CheA